MFDIDMVSVEPTQKVGVILPKSLADAIERRARQELIGKSAWVRRTLLAELTKDQPIGSSKDAAQ